MECVVDAPNVRHDTARWRSWSWHLLKTGRNRHQTLGPGNRAELGESHRAGPDGVGEDVEPAMGPEVRGPLELPRLGRSEKVEFQSPLFERAFQHPKTQKIVGGI